MGFEHTLVGVAAAWTFVLAAAGTASAQATTGSPSSWPDGTTSNTPFPRSMRIKNDIRFSGRYFTAPNAHADTFYPSWASDGSMYSPYADGQVNGTSVQGYGSTDNENTASVRVDGDDPTALTFTVVSTFGNSPLPYAGRYPSASLVYGGVWYYGTYALDDLTGPCGNWCTQETQADRKVCQVYVDCYLTNNCGPSSCGGPNDVCGVNVIRPASGTVPKIIADQVYQCMGARGALR